MIDHKCGENLVEFWFQFFLRNNILDPYSSRVMIQEPTEGMSPRSVVSVKWVLGSPSDPLFLLIQQRSLCLALTFVICSYPYTTLTTVNSPTGCPVKHILSPYEIFIHVSVLSINDFWYSDNESICGIHIRLREVPVHIKRWDIVIVVEFYWISHEIWIDSITTIIIDGYTSSHWAFVIMVWYHIFLARCEINNEMLFLLLALFNNNCLESHIIK